MGKNFLEKIDSKILQSQEKFSLSFSASAFYPRNKECFRETQFFCNTLYIYIYTLFLQSCLSEQSALM